MNAAGNSRGAAFRLLLIAGPALLATGCSVFDDPVQEQWESRQEYPSCGAVRLNQGEQMDAQATQEIECLRKAIQSRQGAELKLLYPTTEGDPIREYYRLTPEGALEVYIDSTDDPNSDEEWSTADCYSPEWLPEISCP